MIVKAWTSNGPFSHRGEYWNFDDYEFFPRPIQQPHPPLYIAGVLTPGGPMVSVPLMVALATSGVAMGPLVAYMTAWSLFGMQRIIAWEAPLMGWKFVAVRVVPSLAFPVIAGWLADNYSRKRALMVSLAVSGVFTATLAVTTGLTTFLVLCFWQAWALAEFGASYRPM